MNLETTILFEDEDILVINKPAGVVVNQAETVTEMTVQSWHEARVATYIHQEGFARGMLKSEYFDVSYGTPEEIFAQRGGVVHRLDKDTSGVLILAKHPASLLHLLYQFRERLVQKEYLCLVHGKVQLAEATLDIPLGRASRDRKLFAAQPDGRPAVTKYRVEEMYGGLAVDQLFEDIQAKEGRGVPSEVAKLTKSAFKKRIAIYQGFSLVKCWPKTGRTHQIRVHMAHIQHPVVGDSFYLGKKRRVLDPLWCPRQFLHAVQLELSHPRSNAPIVFSAPVAQELQNATKYLLK
ncbi:MAG: RluA family pseudouridine synthase [bacterium]|nr:RluA family pseudouridine synthase [bacterium]